jgi:hypothetical protein
MAKINEPFLPTNGLTHKQFKLFGAEAMAEFLQGLQFSYSHHSNSKSLLTDLRCFATLMPTSLMLNIEK